MSSDRPGPTIVLIGGQVTLDSGATLDTRQPLAADEWDVVMRSALGSSEAWWAFAKELVDTILTQHAETDAWALAWLDRTLKKARADGTFTRVRPRSFLDNAGNLLEAPMKPGSSSFRSDAVSSRYRLLPYLLRFDDLVGPAPAAVVGGFHTTYDDGTDLVGDRPLDYFVSRWPEAVVVLPHTPLVEKKARHVLSSPPSSALKISGLAEHTHPTQSRRYTSAAEQVDSLRRADSYVISHDFHVTFWADEGVLRDPVDLDAALTFVKSRYDLHLGLWDLARDPVLRTLLQREEPSRTGTSSMSVPTELAVMADEKAARRQEAKAAEAEGRGQHHELIWPTLSALDWQVPPWQSEGQSYRLAFGPWVPSNYTEGADTPGLYLSLAILKRQAVLSLLEPARTGRTEQFLREQGSVIQSITGMPPDPDKQAVWRIANLGYACSPQTWPRELETLQVLVEQLGPSLRLLAGDPTTSVTAGQPEGTSPGLDAQASSAVEHVAERRSLFDRLTRRRG